MDFVSQNKFNVYVELDFLVTVWKLLILSDLTYPSLSLRYQSDQQTGLLGNSRSFILQWGRVIRAWGIA